MTCRKQYNQNQYRVYKTLNHLKLYLLKYSFKILKTKSLKLLFATEQFFEREHIEQLARVVDEIGIDVFAFGILTDFRTKLFPGSERLIELADRVLPLQVEALCWCGARATHNARVANGVMVTEGNQILPGDVGTPQSVGYEVLCRKHHMAKLNSARSH